MKLLLKIAVLVFCVGLFFSISSCAVELRQDHGNHRGWYKSQNKSHYRAKPGKTMHESKHKPKHKSKHKFD